MTSETVTAADIAAMQLSLPGWVRWTNTFRQLWQACAEVSQGLLAKPDDVEIENEGNVVWQWAFCVPPRPKKWWVAFLIRYPEASGWWQEADLPKHPHVGMLIGTDNEPLVLPLPGPLPDGWQVLEKQFVTAKPLSEFPVDPDAMAAAMCAWATTAMRDARSIIEMMRPS
jgi:hypothetical protein